MRVIVTTVIRHSKSAGQASGQIIEVDWPGQCVTRSLAVPGPMYPASNTNPRGGFRGGRGVKAFDGLYYVANYDTVHVYDSDWRLQGRITHPLATDIHEIDVDASGIWLSCSSYDLALKLGPDGRMLARWHVSESPGLMRAIGIRCALPNLDKDYRRQMTPGLDHTHLNCVQAHRDGTLTINLGQVKPRKPWQRVARRVLPLPKMRTQRLGPAARGLYGLMHGTRSCIVQVNLSEPGEFRILSEHPALRPNHNGQLLSEEATILASEAGGVVLHDLRAQQSRCIPVPATWTRGIAKIDEQRLLVGIQPCAVAEVDLPGSRVIRHFRLSDHPHESVHGLAIAR